MLLVSVEFKGQNASNAIDHTNQNITNISLSAAKLTVRLILLD